LLARHLGDVRGIHGHPAVIPQENLGPAMLTLGDGRTASAEGLVAERRGGHADAVDVARGHADGSDETDEESVDVAAFAAEALGLEHRLDVAHAAAAHLWLAAGVGQDP